MDIALAAPDLDNGPRTPKSGIERSCALTRRVRPVGELLRFVVSPAGDVTLDLKRKLPGRGLWLSADRETVAQASKRGVFAKGFRRAVTVAPALAADIDGLLVQSCANALAIVGKAGQVVAGFAKVEQALLAGEVVALIHASDGASDGIRKLNGVAARKSADGGQIAVVTMLSSDELDLALGRSNVIHAALLAGAASKTFLSRCQTLVRYRLADDGIDGAESRLRTE